MLIIDGDLYVYKAGFSTRSKETGHKLVNRETEEIIDYGICSMSEAVTRVKGDGFNSEEWRLTPYIEPQPLENVLGNLKASLRILLEKTGVNAYEMFLTSTDHSNYRYQVAQTTPYKGTRARCKKCYTKVTSSFDNEKKVLISCLYCGQIERKDTISERPFYYDELREYLERQWNAQVIYDQEADDAVGIRYCQLDTTFCGKKVAHMVHIDKDINNIPGWHWNPDKHLEYYISTEEARRHFYSQMLLGDTIDCVPGVPGCGPKVTETLFQYCQTPQDYESIVLEVFQGNHFDVPRFKTSHNMNLTFEQAYARLKEVGQLLWIRTKENEMWQPETKL